MTINRSPSRHVCLLCEGSDELKAVVPPAIQAGLRNGEQCVLVVPEQSQDDWLLELQVHGIDVNTERDRGALRLVSSWGGPASHSLDMGRWLLDDMQPGLQAFQGVLYVVDIDGSISSGMTCEALCHWEATINVLIEGEAVSILCLYDREAMDPDAIGAALRTHKSVIRQGSTFSNPNEESRRILEHEPRLNGMEVDADSIEEMLARLTQVS